MNSPCQLNRLVELIREGAEMVEGDIIYNIASPEKALLDTFYLATKNGNRFKRLPEIEFNSFNKKLFLKLLKQYPQLSQNQMLERFKKI